MQEIIVTIDDAGEVKVEVAGVTGGSCVDLTEKLEAALGVAQADGRELKPEYNQKDVRHVNTQRR